MQRYRGSINNSSYRFDPKYKDILYVNVCSKRSLYIYVIYRDRVVLGTTTAHRVASPFLSLKAGLVE